jgi:hypothetical protein
MPRWIAFDQETSSLLRTSLAQQAQDDRIETFGRGALDYALAKPGAVVTLLPTVGGEIGLAVFRPPRPARVEPTSARVEPCPPTPSAQAPSALPRASAATPSAATRASAAPPFTVIRAGGFLGLSDESVFEEEQSVEKKKGWWRKFWDE